MEKSKLTYATNVTIQWAQIKIMALNWDEYLICVNSFLSVSKSIDDGWIMIEKGSKQLPENCYLSKNVVSKSLGNRSTIAPFEETVDADLSSVVSYSQSQGRTIIWDYHVLYSPSYSVPVLYFNVRETNGKLLTLEEVWTMLNISKEGLSQKWSCVSQQEHPILLRPYFYLHPCKSFEFLKLSENSLINPLVTWLSSISHIVHLNIPIEYGKELFKR